MFNLKTEEGKIILYQLVDKMDVVIEANRPGVLKRRGMDYESLSVINPQIIYCSITGYGQEGPYAQKTGHEINAEWIKLLDEADIGTGPVYNFREMFADPHFKYRKALVEVEHPKLGKIKLLNTPFKLSETPAEVKTRPPLWGEHTREILVNILCYSETQIKRLYEEGVIE